MTKEAYIADLKPANSYQRSRAISSYWALKGSNERTLFDVYAAPSKAKQRAWLYCQQLQQKLGGYGLTVVSYNVNIFVAAFHFIHDGELYHVHIAPSFDAIIKVDFDARLFVYDERLVKYRV